MHNQSRTLYQHCAPVTIVATSIFLSSCVARALNKRGTDEKSSPKLTLRAEDKFVRHAIQAPQAGALFIAGRCCIYRSLCMRRVTTTTTTTTIAAAAATSEPPTSIDNYGSITNHVKYPFILSSQVRPIEHQRAPASNAHYQATN